MDSHIVVRGAREHNLRSVDLVLPRERLIVFCGVSGSGKTSLAVDTLHVEGQRRYLEALAVGRPGLPELVPPRVDRLEGLPPTLALVQRAAPAGPRATVGSVTEIDAVLRVLFARAGTLHCPRCGRAITPSTHDEIVDALSALPMGTRLTLEAPVRVRGENADGAGLLEEMERSGFSRLRVGGEVVRIDEVKTIDVKAELRVVVDRVRIEPDRRARLYDSVRIAARAGKGVVIAVTDDAELSFVDRPYCAHDDLALPALEPALFGTWSAPGACPTCAGTGLAEGVPCAGCAGTRLSPTARAARWRGRSFEEVQATPLGELALDVEAPNEIERVALADIARRVDRTNGLALGALALRDRAERLSTSEVQRLRLVRQVASPLSGVLYLLDEPSAGLSPELVDRVVEVLRELVAAGNTVVAVEHAPAVIRAADHVVEFGPGAGVAGGRVLYEGPPDGLLALDTPTGRWLSGRERLLGRARPAERWVRAGDVRLPRERVGVITGPSGSGKSTLLQAVGRALAGGDGALEGAEGLTRPIVADRGAAKAARSTPATYIGLWDVMRELLAATRDASVRALPASAFSLNAAGGRCEACKGSGERLIELGPLPDLVQVCPVCEGRRFQRDVLEVRWKGLDASELLAGSADTLRPVLAGHPRLEEALRALVRVGLGYVPLGQGVHTLSGGEARRLVLARELTRAHKRGADDTVYLLDDPSVGLHPQDTAQLVGLLRELADEGATVWASSVDPLVIGAADEVVTLPERRGGAGFPAMG